MSKRALMIWGGWDGHTPKETTAVFSEALRKRGCQTEVVDTLAVLENKDALLQYDVIFPCWTCGEMSGPQWEGLDHAIRSGVGFAGVHGGMGDAFRGRIEYQWMVGGQFLGHPYCGKYRVNITDLSSPITAGMGTNFEYESEQYYMQVDPGIAVLANTLYSYEDRQVMMPVVWTKSWGKGKVFYSALGHNASEFTRFPHVLEMSVRGIIWATR